MNNENNETKLNVVTSDGTKNTGETVETKKVELTQEEINEIIEKRIARERKKYEDYDVVKQKASEYEKLLEEKRLAELSEKERLEEIAKKHEAEKLTFAQELEKLRELNKREKINNEFIKQATKNNIAYIDDALKLADFSAVVVDDEGVKGVEDVVKSLVESKPFLLAQKQVQPQKIGAPSNPAKNATTKTNAQRLAEAREKAKSGNPADIAKYMRLKRELGD